MAPTQACIQKKYVDPINITESTIIKAIAINARGETSYITTARYKKAPHNWTIKLNTAYEQQYDGGGANGLIDDLRGEVDWRKGNWQGYQKADMDVVIDLQETKSISKLNISFLQDTRAWIVAPKQLIVEVSTDDINFRQVFLGDHFIPIEDLDAQVINIEVPFKNITARYIRLRAAQYGKLPAWHEGAGGDTHIFVDEIMIK